MTPRTISLITSRNAEAQRAHFAIFVPAAATPDQGTLIQAVGAPMMGYVLEFKRNYSFADSTERFTVVPVGDVDSANIVDSTDGVKSSDAVPRGKIEIAASQIPTPGMSENFLAPVNEVGCTHIHSPDWADVSDRRQISAARSGRWSSFVRWWARDCSIPRLYESFSLSAIHRVMVLVCSRPCRDRVRTSRSGRRRYECCVGNISPLHHGLGIDGGRGGLFGILDAVVR